MSEFKHLRVCIWLSQTNFERDGGDGHYPPPSLHSLLSIYLIHLDDSDEDVGVSAAGGRGSRRDAVNANLKHRLVQYIFLDVASYLAGEKWGALIEHLVS